MNQNQLVALQHELKRLDNTASAHWEGLNRAFAEISKTIDKYPRGSHGRTITCDLADTVLAHREVVCQRDTICWLIRQTSATGIVQQHLRAAIKEASKLLAWTHNVAPDSEVVERELERIFGDVVEVELPQPQAEVGSVYVEGNSYILHDLEVQAEMRGIQTQRHATGGLFIWADDETATNMIGTAMARAERAAHAFMN